MPRKPVRWALLTAVVLSIAVCAAQEIKQVPADEALRHVIKRVEPKYPAMADLAHIQGDVIVRAVIDENGKVTEAKGVTGHPMLLEAAVPAVKDWKFEPFVENGKPVPVATLVKVGFWQGPGSAERRDYLQQEVECTKPLQANQFTAAEPLCKKALATAVRLPKNFDGDKVRAYGNAGEVAFGLKKFDEAVEDFKQQVNFAQQALQVGNPQMIQVQGNLAHAYVAAGQLQQADAAYADTEKAQEAAAAELETRKDKLKESAYRGIKASYDHNMLVILQEHVAVLRKLGKTSEAEALEQKAAPLALNK